MVNERDRTRPLPPPRTRRPGPRPTAQGSSPIPSEPSPPVTQPRPQALTVSAEQIEATSALAYSLHQEARYHDAFRAFEGLIALDPSSAYAYRGAAASLLALGQANKALDRLDEALVRARPLRGIQTLRAQVLLLLGDGARARAALEEAIRAPEDPHDEDEADLTLARALLVALDER